MNIITFEYIVAILILLGAFSILVITFASRPFNNVLDTGIIIIIASAIIYGLLNIPPVNKSKIGCNLIKNNHEGIHESFSNSNNNIEDITEFSRGLVIYMSCFSSDSYSGSGKEWKNISRYFLNENNSTCSNIINNETSLMFEYTPPYTYGIGFDMTSTQVVGPESHKLGITTSQFTIFMTCKFMTYATVPTEEISLCKLYGTSLNTDTNNAMEILLDDVSKIDDDDSKFKCNFKLKYGTDSAVLEYGTNGEKFEIDVNKFYLFFVTKNGEMCTLYVSDQVGNISTIYESSFKQKQIVSTADVQFSNLPMKLNKNRNANCRISNLGIINQFINQGSRTTIFQHICKNLQNENPIYSNYQSTIDNLSTQLSSLTTCPYDDTTCQVCSDIVDWSGTDYIFKSNEECREKINEFCKNNQTHKNCICWNHNNHASKSKSCKRLKSIFNDDYFDVSDNLEKIKRDNNLCECTTNAIEPAPQDVKLMYPARVNNVYDLSKSDIDIYKDISVIDGAANPLDKYEIL